MFEVATKLWGLQFVEHNDFPKYHPDVKTIEVLEADGTHIGVLLQDFHPRASKRGGAWMSSYRKGYSNEDGWQTPIIVMVMNFSKPTADKPSLLTFEEVSTMFHEFGHVLHGILTKCNYQKISGTSVARDFVELPSQIMENWAGDPQVMKMYARHYETGEVIPDELIEKLKASSHFNQGFATVEYTSAAFLDMDWHTIYENTTLNAEEFETASMNRINMLPEIVVRYRTTYFRHIFAGGYSAGYYGYLWAEVLDADAFEAFKETDIFDKETARKFREFILEKGGTEDPMKLYVKFRGQEPSINPMLKRKGLL
jgi:peptidyl-dipeptidase Dcp